MRIAVFILMGVLPLTACSQSTPSEEELFDTASKFETSQNYDKAIETYDLIIQKYPDSPNRYKAIFMKGYIYTDFLKDKNRAIEALDMLLKEYPDCDLADDARIIRDVAEKGADLMSVFEDSVKSR